MAPQKRSRWVRWCVCCSTSPRSLDRTTRLTLRPSPSVTRIRLATPSRSYTTDWSEGSAERRVVPCNGEPAEPYKLCGLFVSREHSAPGLQEEVWRIVFV